MIESDERISRLAATVEQHRQRSHVLLTRVKEFSSVLYTQLDTILQQVEQESGELNTERRRKALEAGFESFSFLWEGAYIEFLPTPNTALTSDEPIDPRIPQAASGRIMVYRGKEDNLYEAYPTAEIFVFEDGGWAATGFAGIRAEAAYNPENLREFALTFLEHLTYNLITYHRPRKEMRYNPDMREPAGSIGFRRNS
jgi:hypothetical protein